MLRKIVEHHKQINDVDFRHDTITNHFIDIMWEKSTKEFSTEYFQNKPMTVAKVELPNGFIILETSLCIDPKKYSFEMGKDICEEKIRNKMWELYGFFLQEILHY